MWTALSASHILHIRLHEEAVEALAGVQNRTEFIHCLIIDRRGEWHEALMHLREHGWADNAIMAAMEATRDLHFALRPGARVAHELRDAERLSRTATLNGVPGDAWAALCIRVQDDRTLDAVALRWLTRAYWSEDDAIKRKVGPLTLS